LSDDAPGPGWTKGLDGRWFQVDDQRPQHEDLESEAWAPPSPDPRTQMGAADASLGPTERALSGPSGIASKSMTPKLAALLAGSALVALVTFLSWSQYLHPHNVVVHGPSTEARVVSQWTSTSCGRSCSKTSWAKVQFDANGKRTISIVELSKPVSGTGVSIVYDSSNPSRVEEAGANTGRLLISLGFSVLLAFVATALWRQYSGPRRSGHARRTMSAA